ncbi:hypothetical protein EV141_1667 [Microcella putealis]|uniref:Alpha/beta hydrolase family protein n=1 Tax=Microcella putealis TaxID=337005 RepID=A0A4Q7LNP1_9MICO|nr:hypothetical protein [Microcella putealis]RZS56214.1 hypothetical protein EV141_1667 [Microcella putealis]TQM27300.1 hypothetical protein BJ957_0735 [Microcella putealis]
MRGVDGNPHDGLTVVHSDVLTSIEVRYRDAAARSAEAAARGRRTGGLVHSESVVIAIDRALADAESARQGLIQIAVALEAAHQLFDAADGAVQATMQRVSSQIAALVGMVGVPLLAAAAVPLIGPSLVSAVGFALLPDKEQEKLLALAERGLEELGRSAATPEGAALVGWLANNIGSLALGAIGVPPHLAASVGEGGLDLVNLEFLSVVASGVAVATGASGVAGVRVTQQTVPSPAGTQPHQVSKMAPPVFTQPVTAPTSVADRHARVPDGAGSQVRIETYAGDNGPRYEVYIAGTDPKAEFGGVNPFDMASNLALTAHLDASSLKAVVVGLEEAGATAQSEVVFTGHSQGALVAAYLAESGQYRTAGLVTAGGPVSDVPISGDYPAIVIEHTDDIIPSITGEHDAGTRATVIEARAFPGGAGELFAPHAADAYVPTARLVDAADDYAITHARDRLPSDPVQGTATMYRGERILDGDDESGGRGRADR